MMPIDVLPSRCSHSLSSLVVVTGGSALIALIRIRLKVLGRPHFYRLQDSLRPNTVLKKINDVNINNRGDRASIKS